MIAAIYCPCCGSAMRNFVLHAMSATGQRLTIRRQECQSLLCGYFTAKQVYD